MPERKIASEKILNVAERPATLICLALIRFYRLFISPLKPPVCRFYPTCSQYTYEAVLKYGFFKGLFMGLKRVLSCHPFNPGGYHPVE